MIRNRKGFTGIELAIVMIAIAAIGYFAVPPMIKAAGTIFSGGDKNQAKMTHKVEESYSMFYKDEKGNYKPAPVPYKRKEESMNYNSEAPKPTLWDTFKKWIFLLGALAIIFPSFGVWLFKRFKDMKNNLTQLVTGIEEAKKELPPDAVAKLETNLSKKMDTSAKTAVKKIKVKL